ncbi:ATP-binding cassette domain-containing protein [Pseudomonas sp. 13.2]|uniref:ATP-binding cassette domain-containing protein n=1 Tax=Pseudomonas sp. 13.2 TaxID=3144665 RepID=A0AAU7BJZ0_9PSED
MFELRNVTKSYLTPNGRRYVFRNLSLAIPPGKNIGLIGRNGAGKSTLMRLLGGADVPDSGSIVTDRSISWPVGLTGGFQGSMTGRDNIKFVCRIYGAEGESMREKIRFVQEFAEMATGSTSQSKRTHPACAPESHSGSAWLSISTII